MIKVFIPEIKRKYGKPKARGFWRNGKGITSYDYITVKNYNQSIEGFYYQDLFYNYLGVIKASYNQEALFYIKDNVGYCFTGRDKIEVLQNRIYKEVLRANLKVEIKEALKVYGGVTIYQEAGRYYKEIFYK